jgi:hypothetical protein
VIDEPKRIKFVIKNTSEKTIRYNWNEIEDTDFTVKPRVGHLPPGGTA